MTTKTAYTYNFDNKAYGTSREISIKKGYTDYILPPFATWIDPTTVGDLEDNQTYSFTATDSDGNTTWEIVADYRGETVYSTTDQSSGTVTALGEIPDGYTLTAPTTAYDVWTEADDGTYSWVADASAKLDADIEALNDAYQSDMDSLATAYAKAMLLDGADETTNKDAVTAKLTARKTQYATDLAALTGDE